MNKTYKSYIYFNPVTRVFWFRDESRCKFFDPPFLLLISDVSRQILDIPTEEDLCLQHSHKTFCASLIFLSQKT